MDVFQKANFTNEPLEKVNEAFSYHSCRYYFCSSNVVCYFYRNPPTGNGKRRQECNETGVSQRMIVAEGRIKITKNVPKKNKNQ